MASPVEHRSFPAELELRHEGRTVAGLAVPFDRPTDVGTYSEVFRRGSFERTIAERGGRVKFLAVHDRQRLPLGVATLLREDSAGLYGEFAVSRTTAGDEVLELVRDGALDGLSVGFRPVRDRWDRDRRSVERLEAALLEVSLVPFAAYEDARVLAVRDATGTPAPSQREPIAFDAALDRLFRLAEPVPFRSHDPRTR